jgi:hypothetical protein
VHRLWLVGAVEHVRQGPGPDGPARSGNLWQRGGSQPILAARDGMVIRNLLAAGRPQGVVGTLVWEGRKNAAAVWQARRREKDWKRLQSDEGRSLEGGVRSRGGLRGWFTTRIVELYRERDRSYLPERELDPEQILGPEERPRQK